MKKFNLQTGKLGELVAKNYLEKIGYKIIEQNYRTKLAEIDLIAQKRNEIIFIEVRTKRGCLFGRPEDSFNQRKLRKLNLGAKIYLAKIGWLGQARIDAVCVALGPKDSVEAINHYQNIV